MEITKYIFRPYTRSDTENCATGNERANAARNVITDAERIQFVNPPQAGARALLKTQSQENGVRFIATSTLSSVRFDETIGIIELKTQNSVYAFKTCNVMEKAASE